MVFVCHQLKNHVPPRSLIRHWRPGPAAKVAQPCGRVARKEGPPPGDALEDEVVSWVGIINFFNTYFVTMFAFFLAAATIQKTANWRRRTPDTPTANAWRRSKRNRPSRWPLRNCSKSSDTVCTQSVTVNTTIKRKTQPTLTWPLTSPPLPV